MSSRVTLLLAFLASCQFDVSVGGRMEGEPLPDAGATVLDEYCGEPARYTAFEVRLDPTPMDDPSCWSDGGVPVDHVLPAETFQVLVVSSDAVVRSRGGGLGAGGGTGASGVPVLQDVTLAVDGLGPQRLGDAPVIEVGSAMAGFEWQQIHVSSIDRLSRQERITSARFAFDRLDLPTTAGHLFLESRWTCVHLGGECEPPPDRQWCSVARSFVAQKLTTVPPRWTALTTPALPQGTPFLVSVDLGALSRSGLTCTRTLPTAPYDVTPTLRSLEVWQLAPLQIRVPSRTIEFRGAPSIELRSDFGDGTTFERTQLHGEDVFLDATTRERRSSSAMLLGRACGAFSGDGGAFVRPSELVLETNYECTGDNCQSSTAVDRGSCRVVVPWLNLRLP